MTNEPSNILPPSSYEMPMPQELIDAIQQTQAASQPPQADGARLVIEVVAGVIPLRPMPEHTRRFTITSSAWQQADDQRQLLMQTVTDAMAYATVRMLQPDRFNWVRVDWIWP